MASEMRFSEVRKQLERAGYRLARIHGSHHYFVKPGQPPFSIPVHQGKVKPYYVRQVEKACQGDGPGV
jgi:predicted RNA binding protein YcfA (HicA-like mRNA interferase family)